MEKLSLKVAELESSLKDLRDVLENEKRASSTSTLIVGCGAIFAAVSIFTLPRWISVAIIALFSGYSILDKKKTCNQVRQKISSIQAAFDGINSALRELDIKDYAFTTEESKKKDETISFLKSTVERLKSLLERKETASEVKRPDDLEKSKAEVNMEELLKKIQKLDIEVEDFGEECASYMRKEFNKTLRVCGLEFVDYSSENDMLFATEKAAINNIDCTARAIVTISTPRKIVLKGHAFIPETN